MARASAGVSRALAVGAVFSMLFVLWGATGSAQADVGDVVGAVAGAGGDAGGGVLGSTPADPVAHAVTDPVKAVADPVTHAVTHAVTHPVGTVQQAAEPAADRLRHAASPAHQEPPLVGAPQPRAKATSASAAHAAGAVTAAKPSRHRAHSGRSVRARQARGRAIPRAEALRAVQLMAATATPEHRQVGVGTEAGAAEACRSASLAPSDLLRCARVESLIPDLGGPGTVLLPIGLAMVGIGLALVARGRRGLSAGRGA